MIAHARDDAEAALQRVAEINTAILAAQIIPALFQIDAELASIRLLGDDVDDAADGIAAIQRRERAGNDLDALDVRDEGNPPVHLAGTGVLNGLAVEQDEGFVLIDAAQGHAARPGGAL